MYCEDRHYTVIAMIKSNKQTSSLTSLDKMLSFNHLSVLWNCYWNNYWGITVLLVRGACYKASTHRWFTPAKFIRQIPFLIRNTWGNLEQFLTKFCRYIQWLDIQNGCPFCDHLWQSFLMNSISAIHDRNHGMRHFSYLSLPSLIDVSET
jgi:hypothetical protein